jgi:cytochrome c oxidase subunit II
MKSSGRKLRFGVFCRLVAVLAVAIWLATTSCAGHQQSVIDPAGTQADKIANLWWFFTAILSLIFLLVMGFLLRTLMRRPPREEQECIEKQHRASEEHDRALHRGVTISLVLTVLILFVLLVASVGTGKSLVEIGDRKDQMTIEVTGNQWWWQFRYVDDADPSRSVVTANEIHIPVGKPVKIRAMSNDVIHSFWVPNLHGKRDLIPSRINVEWIEANQPGVYRGQCAEFCGLQHAHMSFWVVAEPADKFESWYNAQVQPAPAPSDPVLAHGAEAFLNYECIYCHTIRGTSANGHNAPDLTHFGSRRSIAAGTLPNTPGNLAGWIVNPQSIKPGNHMATIAVDPADLQPLINYLESLK